jgi:hypothetical protein
MPGYDLLYGDVVDVPGKEAIIHSRCGQKFIYI